MVLLFHDGVFCGPSLPEAPTNGGHDMTEFALGCVYFSGTLA